jgi:hypothetical protein
MRMPNLPGATRHCLGDRAEEAHCAEQNAQRAERRVADGRGLDLDQSRAVDLGEGLRSGHDEAGMKVGHRPRDLGTERSGIAAALYHERDAGWRSQRIRPEGQVDHRRSRLARAPLEARHLDRIRHDANDLERRGRFADQ